jgi:hemoglobin/transferrin/lactoferrin receptor protein
MSIARVAMACLLAVAPASHHLGAATNDAVSLSDVAVTATRDARPLPDTPYAASLLGGDALRGDALVRTLPDALAAQPSTLIQKTAHAQGSPYIRGFTGYRNLFLIDGIRLNNSVFRDGPNQYWSTVDPLGLSRLEILRGTASVLYGSDAIGGTVQAITRGEADLRPDSDWDRHLYYRYASAERSHIARAETIGRLTDKLTLTAGYSYKNFGDVQGGHDVGRQSKTGYDERDWDAKLEYAVHENGTIVLAHQSVDVDDAWRTHSTIHGIDWEGLSVGKDLRRSLDQDRDLTYLQYHGYALSPHVDAVHAGVSVHRQQEEEYRVRTGNRYSRQGFDCNTAGGFLSLVSPTPLGQLVYGTEYYHDAVDSFSRSLRPDGSTKSRGIQGPVADDAAYEMAGAYVQDTIAAHRQLELILGVRHDYARADANAVEDPLSGDRTSLDEDWDHVSGSARLLYRVDEAGHVRLYTGASQGFRAPNLSDLTRFDSARTDELETPAPDLNPEETLTGEVGAKVEAGGFSGEAAYYYTAVNDLIVRTPTGRIIDGSVEVTKRNAGDGFVQGIELNARYRFACDLSAFAVFSWMNGEVDTYPTSEDRKARETIDRLMPPTGTAGLRYDHGDRWWVALSCTAAGRADKLSTRDAADTSRIPPGGTPGYAVVDARAGWRVQDGLRLTAAVENITDKDYRTHGSGINEPGRNLVLAADWVF